MKKERVYCQRWVWRRIYKYLREAKAWGLLCFYYIASSLSFLVYFLLWSASNSSLQLLKSCYKDRRNKTPIGILVWKRLESFSDLTRKWQPSRFKRSPHLWPLFGFWSYTCTSKAKRVRAGPPAVTYERPRHAVTSMLPGTLLGCVSCFPRGKSRPSRCCW